MSIVREYLIERVGRYNQAPSDDLLYRIGTHANILEPGDGILTPLQRYRVFNWLAVQTDVGFTGLEVTGDLALHIFGREQLTQWLETSRRTYPDFEFYLPFEFLPKSYTGWESGINFSLYWMPKPGAPMPDPEGDFPWKLSWDLGEMFWHTYFDGAKNDFDSTLSVYPNQQSFTKSGWVCEAGDRYTTPTDEERDLMSIAQVLNHFAIPA